MSLSRARASVREDGNVISLEEVLDSWRYCGLSTLPTILGTFEQTFVLEYVLLCRFLSIDAVELEAVLLGEVLRVWDLDDGWFVVCAIVARDNLVAFVLRLQERSNSRDDPHTHCR